MRNLRFLLVCGGALVCAGANATDDVAPAAPSLAAVPRPVPLVAPETPQAARRDDSPRHGTTSRTPKVTEDDVRAAFARALLLISSGASRRPYPLMPQD